MKAITIKVIGKVQGVWFRASTQKKALELGVVGNVRNLEDGSVWVEAQAEEPALQQLIDWCHLGSPNANVLECIVTETEPKEMNGFVIIR